MKTSLEDINPFRKFAMVLSRFNLLLPRLKAPCGASYPWKFRPNLMGNFSLTTDSDSRLFFFGIASSRSVIGSGNSCLPLNWSGNKPRTKRACPHVFSRASGSLPALTLKSDWLLVTFPFILIALFSLWYHSIVLLFFQLLSIECPKTETKVITTYYQSEQMLPSLLSSKNRKLKRGKTRVIEVGLVFVLHLTGWNDGTSFLDQSKSKVKHNWCNSGTKCLVWHPMLPWGLSLYLSRAAFT